MKILKTEELVVLQKQDEEIDELIKQVNDMLKTLSLFKTLIDGFYSYALNEIKTLLINIQCKKEEPKKEEVKSPKLSLKEIYDIKSTQSPYYKLRPKSRVLIDSLLNRFHQDWIRVGESDYKSITKGCRFTEIVRVLEKRGFCDVIREGDFIKKFKFNFKTKENE